MVDVAVVLLGVGGGGGGGRYKRYKRISINFVSSLTLLRLECLLVPKMT